ncbi:enoyl-CoA hydratase/isomerase family protein [Halopenitus sp. POP-27]|uniref:enoyl-CoA hydratase/isomerase family protein n=1 Tax=Halopenitus sp. POP-27 TaxID=2994425 RepID=UPI002469AEFE|nr:enoyl-CoA hydratase/isomerase family protein [Halopenitus sp. POP-27]
MSEPDYDAIAWSFDEDTGVGRIELDRPDAMNAINDRMQRELIEGFRRFRRLEEDRTGVAVRAIVVSGAGDRAFSTGLDVGEMQSITDYGEKKRIPDGFHEMAETIERCEPPVIARIDGLCLGGGLEIALASDFRLASKRSSFGQPEVNFGVLPGGGGAQRLSMIVGVSRAKELCMTGEQIDAEQAASEGIIDHVHPAADLTEEVESFVESIVDKPPLAVRTIKEAADRTREVGFEEALQYGNRAWLSLSQTRDYDRAVEAFGTDADVEWEGR